MAQFEALYGRRCSSPIGWFELGQARLLVIDLVHDALEKVKLMLEWLHTAQPKQKNYVDIKVRDVAYMEVEKVLLQVSPIKGVMRFGKKGKWFHSMRHRSVRAVHPLLTYFVSPTSSQGLVPFVPYFSGKKESFAFAKLNSHLRISTFTVAIIVLNFVI
nr:uncharacterized protein LOC104095367 [Nicotiana tomentosiformis]